MNELLEGRLHTKPGPSTFGILIHMDPGCVFSIKPVGASGLCKHVSVPPDAVIGKLFSGHKISFKDTKVKPEDCCCLKNKNVTFISLLKCNFTNRCSPFILAVRYKPEH